MAAPARALREGDSQRTDVCPKGECNMIAGAALIEEGLSTEKENGAKSDVPYSLTDIPL